MTHATNKDDGGTDPIHALAAMEERLKAVEEYLGIIVGSANFTLPKASPEIASLVQEIQKNPLNAMCDNEGQTTNPLKDSDRPNRERLSIFPDHPGQGGVWNDEAARSVPVGWLKVSPRILTFVGYKGERKYHGMRIHHDPSIPWGEMYEAILPSEAREGDEYWSVDRWWKSGGGHCHPRNASYFPWRRRKSPAEPAPGSDAEHPPIGYRLAKLGENRAKGYIYWRGGAWRDGEWNLVGYVITRGCASPIANPAPANEGDSQKAGLSDKIAESVVQDLQQAFYDRAKLRATVERLTAELDTTKRLLAESLVERDRLRNLHDARKVRIDGFRDVLREHLGDLV